MSKTQIPNSIKAKVFLACTNDELRLSLQHVLFDGHFAVATDANVLVCYDLRCDLDDEIIKYLDGKMVHADQMKAIFNQMILPPTNEDKEENKLTVHHNLLGRIRIDLKHNGDDDCKFPQYKAVIPPPDLQTDIPCIGLDTKKLTQLSNALIAKNRIGNVKFQFHGANRATILKPLDLDMRDSFGLIMPVALLD
jgi:hypothetical protein